MKVSAAALLPLLAAPIAAQDVCEGNGLGNVYMETTPAYIGGFYEVDMGSPDLPFGLSVLSISDGFGPTVHPLLGLVCLDVFSPAYQVIVLPLDGTGNIHLAFGLPALPTLVGFPPFYGAPATINGIVIETGKTVPVFFENADSYTPAGTLGFARSMHRATALGQDGRDNRIQVFISGGGTGTIFAPASIATTEIFQPLDRTLSPGPDLSEPRAFHTATLLENGNILIAGGCDGAGIVTNTCEIYDHATGTMSPTGSMNAPRIGHTATLLDDGRVFVAGGLSDFQNADTALATVLNTAQNTGEVYDPSTGLWTATSNTMSSVRSAHEAELLPDGRVFLISGIDGGMPTGIGTDVATFTATCDYYDPTTNAFSSGPPIPIARAFHGASIVNSEILVTGGLITAGPFGEAFATTTCYTFNGSTWSSTGALGEGVAFHGQETVANGTAIINGGYIGDFVTLIASSQSGSHDGTTFTTGAPVGTNIGIPGSTASPRGSHSVTKLWDGSLLIMGGFTSPDTSTIIVLDDGFVYTP